MAAVEKVSIDVKRDERPLTVAWSTALCAGLTRAHVFTYLQMIQV
jgi:hypothetical protein